MLSLSKVIPEHIITENFRWVNREFMVYSSYKNIRKNSICQLITHAFGAVKNLKMKK